MKTSPSTRSSQSLLRIKAALKDRLTDASLELPPLPQVAREVVSMTRSDDADAAKLSALIHRDQALAGHVMRISNSPLYAPRVPIVSLQQAVARLGFRTLSEIAFTASVGGRVFRVEGYEPVLKFLWRQAFASGAFAKEIARMRRKSVDGAFLCGLLHTVGKPVLIRALTDLMDELRCPLPLSDVRALVELHHQRVGVQVAQAWKLPESVVEAIRHYPQPDQADEHVDEVATTCLADQLATGLLNPRALDGEALREHPCLIDLNLYPDDVDGLLAQRGAVLELLEAMDG